MNEPCLFKFFLDETNFVLIISMQENCLRISNYISMMRFDQWYFYNFLECVLYIFLCSFISLCSFFCSFSTFISLWIINGYYVNIFPQKNISFWIINGYYGQEVNHITITGIITTSCNSYHWTFIFSTSLNFLLLLRALL